MSLPVCDLPPRTTGGGHVYAIKFTNGTVKVGQTEDPRGRIGTHRSDASAFGITVDAVWISPSHPDHGKTEDRLIGIAESLSGIKSRREYFKGIDFGVLVDRISREMDRAAAARLSRIEAAWGIAERGDRAAAINAMESEGIDRRYAAAVIDGLLAILAEATA